MFCDVPLKFESKFETRKTILTTIYKIIETAKITCEGISLDLTTRPNGTRSISRDAKMNGVSQLKTSLAQDPEHEISNSTASRNVKYLNNLYGKFKVYHL